MSTSDRRFAFKIVRRTQLKVSELLFFLDKVELSEFDLWREKFSIELSNNINKLFVQRITYIKHFNLLIENCSLLKKKKFKVGILLI